MKILSIHQIRAVLAITTVGALLAVAYIANPSFLRAPHAESATTDNVSGWVWSENIGWVSFNNTSDGSAQNYGVTVDTSAEETGGNGAITGNAWGENIGWVSFDRTKTGNPPSAPFNSGSGSDPIAQVDWSTGKVTGWMRVLAAMDTPAFGVTTWKAPVLISGATITPQGGSSQAVDYNGDYLYLGGDSVLAIIDISNPTGTTQVGTFPIPVMSGWGDVSTDVRYHTIGGTPLVFMTTYYGGLVIVNVTNPTAPVLKGELDLSGESWAVEFSADNKYAFVAGSTGFRTIDIQDLANPILKTTLALPGSIGNGIVVVGNYAYVADRNGGLQIVNITNPLIPTIAGSYTTGFNVNEWAYNVYYTAPYLYVAKHTIDNTQSNSQVLVFDISTPSSPALVTSIGIPLVDPQPAISASIDSGPRSVMVTGDLMFVPSDKAGLYIFDISNILSPQLLGLSPIPYSGKSWEVAVKNNVAYLAGGTNDIFVVKPSAGPWWDGWISLSNEANVNWSGNGVKITSNKFSGYACGGNVAPGTSRNVIPGTTSISTFTTVGGNPRALIFDSVGNLYTANTSSNTVYKTLPSGVSTLFATVDTGPLALAFDTAGNLYTANGNASTITKIDTAGNPSLFATLPGGSHPNALVIDSAGNLYTANNYTNTVSKITPFGVVTNIVVGEGPTSLAFDTAGNLYVGQVNGASSKVFKITTPGATPAVSVFATVPDGPGDLAFDGAGNIYTGNFLTNTVSKITPLGVVTNIAVPGSPTNIAFDAADNLFITNPLSDSISKVTLSGVASVFATIPGANPFDLAFDTAGNLYTANAGANTDTKITITRDNDPGAIGWVDFDPKIDGVSVGPVIGASPCTPTTSGIPCGSCQRIGSCSADVESTSGIRVDICSTGSTTTVPGPSKPTTITFLGKAFPGGKVSIIDKQLNTETIVGQDYVTGTDGSFNISFVGILQALHGFGIKARDKDDLVSQTKLFFINTISDSLVEKDILLSPTIGLTNGQVTRGDSAIITGYAVPGNTIHLELDGILIQDMLVPKNGAYKFEISTGALEFGAHTLRTQQSDPLGEKKSDFSISRTLTVSHLAVVQADLNNDSKIDIRDWSIFLSLWGSKSASGRTRIDFNTDGKVDITDFSIFIKTIRKK